MKKKYLFLLVLLVFAFTSCKKSSDSTEPVSPVGNLKLTIPAAYNPAGTTSLIAAVTDAQNKILSSSDTSYQFNGLSVGTASISISCYNSSHTLIFYQSKSMVIAEGNNTLKLLLSWKDINSHSLITATNSPNTPALGCRSPFVIYENNVYKMWYSNLYNNRVYDARYAESSDGITWQFKSSSPLLTPTAGGWDAYADDCGPVIKDNNKYYMLFCGVTSQSGDAYFGLASSTDGTTWTKNPNPVIVRLDRRVSGNSLIKVGNLFYFYYTYTNLDDGITGTALATSTDLTNWTTVTENVIQGDPATWDGGLILSPSVVYDGGVFKMVYMDSSWYGFGVAKSSDGINWIKQTASAPFFQSSNTLWAQNVRYPNIVLLSNGFRIYYGGSTGAGYQGISFFDNYSFQTIF